MTNLHDHPNLSLPPHPGCPVLFSTTPLNAATGTIQGTLFSYAQSYTSSAPIPVSTSLASWPSQLQR